MIVSFRPPMDEKSLLSYKEWQITGKDHSLVAFSPSQVFGIYNRKRSSHSNCQVGSLLKVLPTWIPTSQMKNQSHYLNYAEEDSAFILLEDSSSHPEGFSGRRVSSSVVDVDLILGWIRYCDEKQKKHCASTTDAVFTSLKVIDCETREIVPRKHPYIALSYVWGSENSSSDPAKPGFLPQTCSQVIEDAMQIVKRLNHRYL
jgi:hypothetical protein